MKQQELVPGLKINQMPYMPPESAMAFCALGNISAANLVQVLMHNEKYFDKRRTHLN
jgi:hypothetical protein